ncbi:TIGR03752 family integrating conjugative element protein [Aliikangiella maris]|uniref:TIGR03752 family integrating conjugative element protein n=2 Tax=Aliikangiella maris TaxID=3162458 RepID=A0ABV2BYE1_9GAMM
MNSNKLIYGGVGLAIVFLMILYFSTDDAGNSAYKVEQRPVSTRIEPVKSLQGDTTADSYASLQETINKGIEENNKIEKTNKSLQRQIKQMKVQMEQLAKRQSLIDGENISKGKNIDFNPPLEKDLSKNNVDSEKQKLIEKTNQYVPKKNKFHPNKDDNGFQLDQKFDFGKGLGLSKFGNSNRQPQNATREYKKNDPNAGWIMPIETAPILKAQSHTAKNTTTNPNSNKENLKVYPSMTIADNSVIYDAKALTYLVGRIPVGGRVADPYPVKIIVGSEILIANGHNLPGIEGMIFSGYATGDMNLKCVRAEMNSYTFVFEDGRKVSYREKPQAKGGKEPLAYLSDTFGLPCVVGEFVSNVAEFLTIQSGLSALSAAGEAYAAAQTTTSTTSLGGGTSAVTGDQGKYVMGKVETGATEDIRKWFLDRQSNSVDAVVVKSGSEVSIHVNRDIQLDYDEAARKIDYHFSLVDSDSLD